MSIDAARVHLLEDTIEQILGNLSHPVRPSEAPLYLDTAKILLGGALKESRRLGELNGKKKGEES